MAMTFLGRVRMKHLALLVFVTISLSLKGECTRSTADILSSIVKDRFVLEHGRASFSEKWLHRMGDSAAECLIQSYSLEDLRSERMLEMATSIISDSFAVPTLIERNPDRRPKTSLLLLNYLVVTRTGPSDAISAANNLIKYLSDLHLESDAGEVDKKRN